MDGWTVRDWSVLGLWTGCRSPLGHVFCVHQGKFGGFALTMLATAPLFIGFIEPLVYKRRLAWREVAAAVVFAGISMVFEAEKDQTLGMALGLTSAFLAAVFSTVNGVLFASTTP